MNFDQWRKAGKHLPVFMRDFHDQKEVFKTIFDKYDISDLDISWRDAHIFTIDYFLWFMADHGFTLQKNRTKVDFHDIGDTLQLALSKRNEQFASLLGLD